MNLKQKLSKKLKKTGGFTLIEMLIVVAIIAILVAVSIPMVNSNLEKAREATDSANERAAKAAAMAEYMLNGEAGEKEYYYDANNGKVIGTDKEPEVKYGQCSKHKGGYVKVKIDTNGIATVEWTGASSVETTPDGIESTTPATPGSGSSSSGSGG